MFSNVPGGHVPPAHSPAIDQVERDLRARCQVMRPGLRERTINARTIHLIETIRAIGTDLSPTANLQVARKDRLQLGSCEYNLV